MDEGKYFIKIVICFLIKRIKTVNCTLENEINF